MKYKFYPNYETVLNHIRRSNPHKEGSSRDALTHGISNVEDHLWTEEIELPIDVLANFRSDEKFGLHQGNLKRYQNKIKEGSFPPAVIAVLDKDSKIYLLDGNHRVHALVNEGYTSIKLFLGIIPEHLEILKESNQEDI